MKQYHVYILASRSRVLYIGMTSKLEQRMFQHKSKFYADSFTAQYNVDQLVYYETFRDVFQAISRERQLKRWLRAKKIELIKVSNPEWRDLSEGWFEKDALSIAAE